MSRVLVTGGTKKDIDAMAVLALNVRDKTPNLIDEMVVFHDGVAEKLQRKFQTILPTRFIRYRCPIPKWKLWQNKIIRYFSPMVFCKIECLKLLEEYDTVIWSDYDVIIKEDISELLEEEQAFSFVCDPDKTMRDMFYKSIDRADVREFDLDGGCICTPLFVFHRDHQKFMQYYEWCIRAMQRYIKYLYLPEQAIFTMMVQKYRIPYSKLNEKIYCTHPKDDGEGIKIIHAYGQPKFWNGLENEDWNHYHKQWLEM
ncbi:MAG: hypothetical protein K2N41_02095 [Lachnospiraceae bacterium]|nr:hypothetical protein [Lachnospiraceae bacterium]MDE7238485.1 hypothetical protein [Lachnospiraceae bacterium]